MGVIFDSRPYIPMLIPIVRSDWQSIIDSSKLHSLEDLRACLCCRTLDPPDPEVQTLLDASGAALHHKPTLHNSLRVLEKLSHQKTEKQENKYFFSSGFLTEAVSWLGGGKGKKRGARFAELTRTG